MVTTLQPNTFRNDLTLLGKFKALLRYLRESTLVRFMVSMQEIFWLALIFMAYQGFSHYQHGQRMTLGQQPLVNDFYFVDYHQIDSTSDRKYRFLPLKITAIDEHNISFVAARTGHSEAVSIQTQVKFDAPLRNGFFGKQETTISRAQLQQWLNSGIVYDIARPESYYIDGWLVLKPIEVARGEDANIRFLARAQVQK